MKNLLLKYLVIIYDVLIIILTFKGTSEAFCPLCVFGAGVGVADALRNGNLYSIGVWGGGLILSSIYFFRSHQRINVSYTNSDKSFALQEDKSTKFLLSSSMILSLGIMLLISTTAGIIYGLIIPVIKGISVNPNVVTETGKYIMMGGAAGVTGAFAASYAACLIKNILPFKIPLLKLVLVLSILIILS